MQIENLESKIKEMQTMEEVYLLYQERMHNLFEKSFFDESDSPITQNNMANMQT